jgi:hypothetical protein
MSIAHPPERKKRLVRPRSSSGIRRDRGRHPVLSLFDARFRVRSSGGRRHEQPVSNPCSRHPGRGHSAAGQGFQNAGSHGPPQHLACAGDRHVPDRVSAQAPIFSDSRKTKRNSPSGSRSRRRHPAHRRSCQECSLTSRTHLASDSRPSSWPPGQSSRRLPFIAVLRRSRRAALPQWRDAGVHTDRLSVHSRVRTALQKWFTGSRDHRIILIHEFLHARPRRESTTSQEITERVTMRRIAGRRDGSEGRAATCHELPSSFPMER